LAAASAPRGHNSSSVAPAPGGLDAQAPARAALTPGSWPYATATRPPGHLLLTDTNREGAEQPNLHGIVHPAPTLRRTERANNRWATLSLCWTRSRRVPSSRGPPDGRTRRLGRRSLYRACHRERAGPAGGFVRGLGSGQGPLDDQLGAVQPVVVELASPPPPCRKAATGGRAPAARFGGATTGLAKNIVRSAERRSRDHRRARCAGMAATRKRAFATRPAPPPGERVSMKRGAASTPTTSPWARQARRAAEWQFARTRSRHRASGHGSGWDAGVAVLAVRAESGGDNVARSAKQSKCSPFHASMVAVPCSMVGHDQAVGRGRTRTAFDAVREEDERCGEVRAASTWLARSAGERAPMTQVEAGARRSVRSGCCSSASD
jgi:hypothetical protein